MYLSTFNLFKFLFSIFDKQKRILFREKEFEAKIHSNEAMVFKIVKITSSCRLGKSSQYQTLINMIMFDTRLMQ
jgi:hypothetical protein